jgi:malonate-semialdehyde dehydrogenase (acetylating)/methylmalonate-semialdehyde dehydrogenase
MDTITHWINGRPTAASSADVIPVHDPATGGVVAQVPDGTVEDVDLAVIAASAAAVEWAEVSLSRRASLMFKLKALLDERADSIAEVISIEHGKTRDDALGEVARGTEIVEFACGIPHLLKGSMSEQVSTRVDSWSVRQPLGVVAGITPFNFPIMVPLWMAPMAIATGNAFILKPSEKVPSASMILAEIFADAGFPPGVFSVVHGGRDAVDGLLDHPGVAAVSFVGSTAVAQHVYDRGTAAGKRVQALGGAKNHAVVMPDADLDVVVPSLIGAVYGSSGQRCMAVSTVVAIGDVGDELVARLRDAAATIPIGPASDPSTEMGPVISSDTVERVEKVMEEALASGAELVLDGRDVDVAAAGCESGWFVGPSILDRVDPSMEAYKTEVFGPLLVVVRADSLDEALDLIAANPYGNGASIFTSSGPAARTFQRYVQAGMVGINVPIPVPLSFYSFGGWKSSLFGDTHIHGPESINFYTRGKVVTSRWADDSTTASFSFPTTR